MPMRRLLLPFFLVGLSAVQAPALARSGCERARAELASLERSERSAGMVDAAQQHRGEAQRLSAYYRSIGCEGGQFSFFGAPPECGALVQRIRAMESTSVSLAASVNPAATNARRGRLRAAVARECQPVEPREAAAHGRDKVEKADKGDADDRADKATQATGGPRLVCVRACDGYHFPLENRPTSKQGASEMCKALCPNAETLVFNAPADGDISKAVSEKGKPYVKLANASRYQKTFDATCSCKKDGQTWAQALERAEQMLEARKGDVVVTAKLSQELSRPKLALSKLRLGMSRTRRGATEQARKPSPDGLRTTISVQGPKLDPDATGTVKPEEEDDSAAAALSAVSTDIGTPAKPRLIKISGN